MASFISADTLRRHRPILLACEAIGWLHMAGKARIEFLRKQAGDAVHYNDLKWHDAESPPFPWDSLLGWVKNFPGSVIPPDKWPNSIKEFTEKHRDRNAGVLGLLQAGHGMASGIEKNLPSSTSEYLSQSLPHLWLSSPFGHPKRNLFADPPDILSPRGWQQLVAEMQRVLEDLKNLQSQSVTDVTPWQSWRERAIGHDSYIRQAFLATLAETRVPNNDVTLWDQSYVAAALFKSALAGAILNVSTFPWGNKNIKQNIRWRLLTVAIGAEHYEARAVKIGDWTGAQAALDEFFTQVAQLVEVDLAAGSLLYRDSSVAVFSFPGERFEETDVPASWLSGWEQHLQQEADRIAESLHLETPPLVRLSHPTRSLVPLVQERRSAVKAIATPVHRVWNICHRLPRESHGHVCPVCRARLNGDPADKGKPCTVCRARRARRLADWLDGRTDYDTIWFEEVADANNRIALLTFALDLEPWLNGERVDSLRAQAIPEWVRFNPVLQSSTSNPIPVQQSWAEMRGYIKGKLASWNPNDEVLNSLQEGFKNHSSWQQFFERIVEDRSDAPQWRSLDNDQRAAWLTHQLFCKLPSPGRAYRFWRESQAFFEDLLKEFRQIAARNANPWRVRRLLVVPDPSTSNWDDDVLYDSRWRGTQFSLVYVRALNGFVTASNLARALKPEEQGSVLKDQTLSLEAEDTSGAAQPLTIKEVKGSMSASYSHLGVYHPVIPLEVSPLRFRVIVPLEAASECLDLALNRWQEQFRQVWDRLPLHMSVVAFERALAFQAVIEAARNLEGALAGKDAESWRLTGKAACAGVVALQLRRPDGQTTLRAMSLRLPDGRDDVFYPYFSVDDQQLRFPRDFRHPAGAIYRHVGDLQLADGVRVYPARVAMRFMDSTAARFEPVTPLYAEDWSKVRALWQLLTRTAPSQTALQRFWSELSRLEQEWRQGPDTASDDLWRDTVRALLVHHLEAKGAVLAELTEAAMSGLLQQAIQWYVTVLKLSV